MGIVKTLEKDLGSARFLIEIQKLDEKPAVKVGWPVEDSEATALHDESDNLTVAEIAIVHEFGEPSQNIPERSMLRATYDAKKKEWDAATDKLAKKIGFKITIDQALDVLGLLMVKDNKAHIVDGILPPLKVREGTPLIDTAQMLNALTFVKIKGKK